MWSGKRAALLAAALMFVLGGCGKTSVGEQETILSGAAMEQAKSYETYEVVPRDVVKSGSMSLTVTYTKKEALRAPDDDLYLDQILVKGKTVLKKGDPIAEFHRESSEAELREAEVSLERAKAERDERLEDLEEALYNAWAYSGGAQAELAQLEYDRAVYSYQRQIGLLQKEVDDQKAAFEPVMLLAPYDCVVDSYPYLYSQQKVDISTVIANISDSSSLALVGENFINNFQYGNQVEVEYGKKSDRKTIKGRVVSTSVLLGDDKQKIWILPEEPITEKELEKPTAKAEIVQIKDAITVPRSAIEMENGSSYVQILIDGVTHKRYIIRGVTVGSTDDRSVVVLSGLEAGQQVVID